MMKKLFDCKRLLVCMGILLGLAVWMPTPAQAMGMDLVSTLVSKLGVTKDQAAGGAGAGDCGFSAFFCATTAAAATASANRVFS